MAPEKRDHGFYWVLISQKWVVAEWSCVVDRSSGSVIWVWWVPGRDAPRKDGDFIDIDERRIKRPSPPRISKEERLRLAWQNDRKIKFLEHLDRSPFGSSVVRPERVSPGHVGECVKRGWVMCRRTANGEIERAITAKGRDTLRSVTNWS